MKANWHRYSFQPTRQKRVTNPEPPAPLAHSALKGSVHMNNLLVRCLVVTLMSRVGSCLAGDLAFLENKGTRCGFRSYCI